jgi:lipid-A-disaccharide synthase
MLDSLETKRTGVSRDPNLVGLFPGSRKKEVSKIFPAMVQAIRAIRNSRPHTRFEAAAASHELADQMIKTIHHLGENPQLCPVTVRESHSLMQRASAGIVCSGTATLEAAFFGLPMSIVYKVATLTWIVGKKLIKVPFLGMPNVLAGREIVRELLQNSATPDALAQETLRLLNSPSAQAKLQEELATVTSALGDYGAAGRAAEAILHELARPKLRPN